MGTSKFVKAAQSDKTTENSITIGIVTDEDIVNLWQSVQAELESKGQTLWTIDRFYENVISSNGEDVTREQVRTAIENARLQNIIDPTEAFQTTAQMVEEMTEEVTEPYPPSSSSSVFGISALLFAVTSFLV